MNQRGLGHQRGLGNGQPAGESTSIAVNGRTSSPGVLTKECFMKLWTKSLVWFLAFAGLVFAGSPKIAKDLDNIDSEALVDVIVQFKQVPTEAHHKKITDRGGQLKRELGLIKGSHYSVPASKLKDLADDPDVAYISPDRPVNAADTPTVFDYKLQGVNADIAQKYG
jgi:hypothetical protein